MVCPMLICGLYFVLIHGIPGCTFEMVEMAERLRVRIKAY
jgi:hypothetical protein